MFEAIIRKIHAWSAPGSELNLKLLGQLGSLILPGSALTSTETFFYQNLLNQLEESTDLSALPH